MLRKNKFYVSYVILTCTASGRIPVTFTVDGDVMSE
jgi:hypothetical protein